MGNIKNELKCYNNDLLKEEEIIQIVESSLIESYEQVIEEDDNEASILSSLRAQEVNVNVDEEEELEIVNKFNLEPIIIIDNIDISRFEKNINEIGNSDNNDDDTTDFNMEDLVKDFIL